MKANKAKIATYVSKYGIYVVFALICILLSIASPVFLTVGNWMNILRQISTTGIIAVGMTFVIIIGGIDLSVGSIVGFSAMVASSLAKADSGHFILLPVLAGIGVGMVCGLINGALIAYGELPPFIATLGMMTIARGAALYYNDGRPIANLSSQYAEIGGGSILGIPNPVLIFLIVIIAGYVLLRCTKYGRYVRAIGGNEDAARVSGIHVNAVKVKVYALVGALSGLSAIILSSRTMSGSPGAGTGYEMDAITAVVIGGASLSGGVGSVIGTLVGSMIVGCLNNGMDLMKISSYFQDIIKGIIIIAAVLIDTKTKKRK